MQYFSMKFFVGEGTNPQNSHRLFFTGRFRHMLAVAPEHRVQFPQRAAPEYFLAHIQHYGSHVIQQHPVHRFLCAGCRCIE